MVASPSADFSAPDCCWLLFALSDTAVDPVLEEWAVLMGVDSDRVESCIVLIACFFRFARFAMMAFAISVPCIMELARLRIRVS